MGKAGVEVRGCWAVGVSACPRLSAAGRTTYLGQGLAQQLTAVDGGPGVAAGAGAPGAGAGTSGGVPTAGELGRAAGRGAPVGPGGNEQSEGALGVR